MSVREFSPLFSWGFSLRRSKWLIPLFNNNVFSFGTSAVNDGPYGYKKSNNNRREKSTSTINQKESSTMVRTKGEGSDIFDGLPSIEQIQVVTEIGNNVCSVRMNSEADHKVELSEEAKQKELELKKKEQDDIKRKEQERYRQLSDGALIDLLENGKLAIYNLEDKLGDKKRAVKIRRMFLAAKINPQEENILDTLPYANDLNYDQVFGACCESVVGYVPLPVGVVGPIIIDGKPYHVPMATVEGCLVASTHRGCKALSSSVEGGVSSVILSDGMTRGPVVQFANTKRCNELKQYIDNPENFQTLCKVFNSDSRFARLLEVKVGIAGRKAFLRFKCRTGDAMGMNMISKATQKALKFLKNEHFPDMDILSLSGNYCTDKKPSAMNWIEGRGKSVVVDATIPHEVVKNVLKTTVDEIVNLNVTKNLIGSAMAGSVGGFNAHAANIVTAIFLATGQDAAQNVESSNCLTIMEKTTEGHLYVSVTMPSIEVGTVGGGTHLDAQKTCLKIMGVAGANQENPGQNAQTLAKCVASTVMAGELSLMAALAADHLVSAHIAHNRKK